jgi:GH15 family glucan-1,4-alpha-glucosidase
MEILDWVQSNALSTGMMAEQVNPDTLEVISPAPLTWTQAEYISTLLDTITEIS